MTTVGSRLEASDDVLIQKVSEDIRRLLFKQYYRQCLLRCTMYAEDSYAWVAVLTDNLSYTGEGTTPLLALYDLLANIKDGNTYESMRLKGPRYFYDFDRYNPDRSPQPPPTYKPRRRRRA